MITETARGCACTRGVSRGGSNESRIWARFCGVLSVGYLLGACVAAFAAPVRVASPDGRSELVFELDTQGRATYSFAFHGKSVIRPSGLGFQMRRGGNFLDGFSGCETKTSSFDETWPTVWGEEREIRDRHNELEVRLLRDGRSPLTIRFRVFDDGVGFRYEFTPHAAGVPVWKMSRQPFLIENERTEFALVGDPTVWWIPGDYESQEYEYHETRASGIAHVQATEDLVGSAWKARAGTNSVQTALMLKTPDGLYVNLHEAACVDFPTLNLEWDPARNALVSLLTPSAEGDRGKIYGDFATPWRTVIVAEDGCGILASRMTLNLNEPCKLKDTSWIRPLKYIGIWWEMVCGRTSWWPGDCHGPNPANVRRYIDFAATNGFDAVLFEGWNDGRPVPFGPAAGNFHRTTPDFDADAVAAYARQKGVGLILHAETSSSVRDFERQADELYAYWHDHNALAIKSGYVDEIQPAGNYHFCQWMNSHYLYSVKKAAEHRVMVNQHEAVRPTGLCRTYPNLIANESARGGEFFPHGMSVTHTLVLPFTRLIGGPMDFTPGILETDLSKNASWHRQKNINTTVCRQLSLYLTIPSPLQMAADLPENYEARPELFDFIRRVPVDWEKSVYLEAEPARRLVVARKDRRSERWYVGGAANADGARVRVDFGFLDADATYRARVWADGEDASSLRNPQSYRIFERRVGKTDGLDVVIAPGGGFVMEIAKTDE